MSILDDDIFDQAYEPASINTLKDVAIENIPALIQAWYDVFYNAIVIEKYCGYQIYPLLCLYEKCFTGLTYREYHGPLKLEQSAYVNIVNSSSRRVYIDRWKQFMVRHIVDEVWAAMRLKEHIDFGEFFVALSGVFSCELLECQEFTRPYSIVIQNSIETPIIIPVPSESYPEHNYLFYKEVIYNLFHNFQWEN